MPFQLVAGSIFCQLHVLLLWFPHMVANLLLKFLARLRLQLIDKDD
jgi:hypothetical protein